MILYADTSALLKLYIEEAESDTVRTLTASATEVWTHLIAYAEARAALAKARRMQRIDDDALRALVTDLDADWARLSVVDVDEPLVRRAGALAEQFALRGFDSVHLAAAERLNTVAEAESFAFAAFDERLCEGAEALGIVLAH